MALVLVPAVLAALCCCVDSQLQAGGYRLESDPTYLILAPRKIYPDEVVQVSVSILKLYHDHINVRASIRKEGQEFASFFERFFAPTTQILQMQMPDYADFGNYSLRVEGSLNGGLGGNIFENETEIIFSTKRVSIFVQTSKPLYKQGQTVKFRVIPMRPNMMPVHGSMDIYAVDPTETVVRRWLAMQTNAGILEMSLQLSDQPSYGTWKIRVDGFGHVYHKTFKVEEFFLPRFFVNVSMPAYMMEDTSAIAGLVTANHTSGRPVRGSGMVRITVKPPASTLDPNKQYNHPFIEQPISFFEGRTDFLFTLEEIRQLLGKSPAGMELHINTTVRDWFLMQEQMGYAVCVIHKRAVTLKLLGDASRTFKPGFPVTVYYAVIHEDGSPLYGNRRQVTITRTVKSTSLRSSTKEQERIIVRDDGIVQYDFVAEEYAMMITIRAYFDTEETQSKDVNMFRVYSYYENYLAISTTTEQPQVDEYMIFTVRTNAYVEEVHYVIVAGGNIVVGNTLQMSSTQKTFSVALSRDMVPSARLVAYFVYNGEVISDALNFFVNGSKLNEVEVRVNMGKDFSRDTVELTGITDPGSFIAFSGIDYEMYQYGASTFITEKMVIEELETYDDHANFSFGHTWYYGEEDYRKVYFPAPSYGVDSNSTFLYSGLVVFTDANVSRILHYCNETQGYLPCNDGSCYLITQRCDQVRQCVDGVDEMGCKFVEDVSPFTPQFQRFRHTTRHFEQDALWLWKGHFTKPDGRIDLRSKVPKEPMSWVVSAFAMSREKGFGVTTRPARYQSTRPFYIQVEMPSDAVMGEQIGVRVALFNYWQVDMECLVTLHDSDDYRFVMVEDFGIVSSYAPRTQRGDVQTMVYVEAGRFKTVLMPVLPVVRGDLNVTVSATSFMGRDLVTRPLHVVMDGVTNYYNTPLLIDLINSGSLVIPDFQIPIPERFVDPEEPQHLYVPGSGASFLSIVGDVVGPGFFEPYLTSENQLRRPYGAGEMNLFNFASNLYYLKFLKTTNQLRDEVLDQSLEFMNLALQRQLSYMNPDGSFSMFRDYQDHTPSVWLTSFVLKTLQDADETDWTLTLYIPDELLNKIASWLCSQQDKTTGAFYETAPIYDRKMEDNFLSDKDGVLPVNVSLTAHVVVALSLADSVTGTARVEVESAKARALQYLEEWVPLLSDPYQTALMAYALTTADSNQRNKAFQKLDALKRTENHMYWSSVEIEPNPTRIINTAQFQYPRQVFGTEGSAVEATSYALIVYLSYNRLKDANAIMKWINSMRNTPAGFSSTRDSIVALQALAEYGRYDTDRDLYNVEISVEFTSLSDPLNKKVVKLTKKNWIDLQKIQAPVDLVYGQVRTVIKGTGMVLMQLDTQVNVEYPWLQYPQPVQRYFNLTMDRLYFGGKNFSIMEMTVCAMWNRPDISEHTGMVVIEVGTPTGYVVMNDELRTYVQSGKMPTLRRAEWYSKKVVFYLDYVVANQKSCVEFRADRWFPVANATIQHILKVYDYYEPGMHNTTLYNTYHLFNLHICQVCGSFQCPYCPFYNIASTLQVNINSLLAITVAIAVSLFPSWFNFLLS